MGRLQQVTPQLVEGRRVRDRSPAWSRDRRSERRWSALCAIPHPPTFFTHLPFSPTYILHRPTCGIRLHANV